ncbi:mpv17-like protein 2 [Rhipicephalus microplus]|uniref:mpv17-like protein 2 n=1 Tax=Rhipicephalus microplus TaxID=6941 RepID=UPI003F6BFE66
MTHGSVHFFKKCTRVLFGRHLVATNATISTVMGIVGDLVQQHYEVLSGRQAAINSVRTSHMAAAGLTTGVVCHYWYVLLDRWMLGRSVRTVLLKVLYDQVVFSPINLVVYFGTVGLLERSSCAELSHELWFKGGTVYKVEWVVWPPAQFLNFYVLPLRYRVFFDNLISFGFDVYLPYVKYKGHMSHANHS